MKKALILFICFLYVCSFAGGSSRITPLRELYVNRHYFTNALNNLSNREFKDTTKNDSYKSKYLAFFVDSAFTVWKQNEEQLLKEFLYIIAPAMAEHRYFQYYLSDSITIRIAASYLDYFKYDVHKGYYVRRDSIWMLEESCTRPGELYRGRDEEDLVRDALNLLIYRTHFPALRKQAAFIRERLRKCNAPLMFKLKLLSLSNAITVTEKEKYLQLIHNRDKIVFGARGIQGVHYEIDSVYNQRFNYLNVPLWLRARLGDMEAENMILNYGESNRMYDLLDFVHNGSFAWSDTIRTVFISLLEKDVPLCNLYRSSKCFHMGSVQSKHLICRSLQDTLIMALARHHPDEMIFSNFYSYTRLMIDYCDLESQAAYFVEFRKWIKKKYNYNLEYKNFKPYFNKDFGGSYCK